MKIANEKLQKRMDEILDTLEYETDNETRDSLVKQYMKLNAAAVMAFKADSDDVNNNNRNEAEMIKSRRELVGKIVSGLLGTIVSVVVVDKVTNFEELGAITSKAWNLFPKWKF